MGLGMKVTVLPYWLRDVADEVFVKQHPIGRFDQRVKALVDFALAARGHFVVVALDVQARLFHRQDHLGAQVLIVVGGRDGEIAFLVTRPVSQVVLLAPGIPAAFFRIDEVVAVLLGLIEADIVKNEELRLGAEVGGVGNAGVSEVSFRLLGDVARVFQVVLFGDRVDDVADHDQRRNIGEGIQHIPARVRDQQHVAFVDRGPAADAGTVHSESVLEGALIHFVDGIGDVMPMPGRSVKRISTILTLLAAANSNTVFGFMEPP